MCEVFVFKWWDALDAGTLKDCYDWSQVSRSPVPCLFVAFTNS